MQGKELVSNVPSVSLDSLSSASHTLSNFLHAAEETICERPQSRAVPTESLSTPSFSMMAIANEMTPRIIEETKSNEIEEDLIEAPIQDQTGVDNLQPQREYPGAFAISGVETAGLGRDDEYTITGTSIFPVTARIVHDTEEDMEFVQEQLHQQDRRLRQQEEQLQRILAERESAAIAQVIDGNDRMHNDNIDEELSSREADLSPQHPSFVVKQSAVNSHDPRKKWIAALVILLVIVGIVLGVVLPMTLNPTDEEPQVDEAVAKPTAPATTVEPVEVGDGSTAGSLTTTTTRPTTEKEPTLDDLLSDGTIPSEIGLLTSLSKLH